MLMLVQLFLKRKKGEAHSSSFSYADVWYYCYSKSEASSASKLRSPFTK